MSEEIKNNQIPEEIKDICRSCENNIFAQNKGCAFRSLGNEYCDYVLNATKLYLDIQQKVEQLEKENFNIRENIHLERISLPPELTKDKNFMELYDMPSYEDLKNKVEQLENIRKEAIDYVYKHIQEYDADGTFNNLDEFDFIASPQVLLNILNKGE